MDPVYFDSPGAFRSWLEAHHASAIELWVGYHKRATATPSLTWPESVDEALCFGWIDGLRRRVDDERYAICFTPHRDRLDPRGEARGYAASAARTDPRGVDVGAPVDQGSAEGDDAVTALATAAAATGFAHRQRSLRAAAALR